jgi:hypothetical protein
MIWKQRIMRAGRWWKAFKPLCSKRIKIFRHQSFSWLVLFFAEIPERKDRKIWGCGGPNPVLAS